MEDVKEMVATAYHSGGTCKMGIDSLSVVSPSNLKVYVCTPPRSVRNSLIIIFNC